MTVDPICRALDERLARIADELTLHRATLVRGPAANATLRAAVARLCRGLHETIRESRRRLRRIARLAQAAPQAEIHAGGAKTMGLPPARLRKVLDHIEASLGQRLDVPSLAVVAGMSPGHFAVMFKRATGMPPHEAVMLRRLARSQYLLADASLSIAEIGCQLGFSSQAHFSTAFRRRLGLSPAQWRARYLDRARPAIDPRGQSSFSKNTKSSTAKFESHGPVGHGLMETVTESPRHADTGASHPGTA